MPATTRAELLAVTTGEYAKLAALIASLDADQAAWAVDGTSIKDVVGHRAHWIKLFLGWYHDGMAGKPVHFPAESYKWNDLKRYNAELRQRQADLDWSAARALLEDRHEALHRFMGEKTEAELYGGPMQGANNNWTPGRWAEAAGPSHYRSASKFIRSVLRSNS